MATAQVPQQPDFDRMSNHFTALAQMCNRFDDLAGEVRMFSNVPPFNAGQPLFDALQEVNRTLATMNRTMNENFTNLRERMAMMEARSKALDANNQARLANSMAQRPENRLKPLRAVDTNTEIPNFPATVGAIAELRDEQVNMMLEFLDAPVPRNREARRKVLKRCIGIRAEAV